MVDLTLCSGEGCPLKDRCYRFVTEGDPIHQSRAMLPLYDHRVGICLYFEKV